MSELTITPDYALQRNAHLAKAAMMLHTTMGRLEENLAFEESTEVLRKAAQWLQDTLNWNIAPIKDLTDNLPIFNIVINGGAVSIESITKPLPVTFENEMPTAGAFAPALLHVNGDVEDALA